MAVFVGFIIPLLVVILLLVIDIGRLYYAQRQLQLDANMAALAGAQAGSGCLSNSGGVPGDADAITAAVQQSLINNRGTVGSYTDLGVPGGPTFEAGNDFSAVSLAPGADSLVSAVEVGQTMLSRNGITNAFKSLAIGDPSVDSVRVTLATQQPSSYLMGFVEALPSFFGGGPGGATPKYLYASATAKQQARGSFYLGTEIASVSGGALNQVLGGLLCASGDTACQNSIIGLDVGDSLKGLAGLNVSLGQLATAVGVNSKDLSDLATVNTTLPGVLNGLSGVLAGVGTTTSVTAATLLKNLAAASTNPNSVPLGGILGAVDGVAAGVPFVDLPDLIVALGEDAQTGPGGVVRSIALPVSAAIPGVTAINTFLSVGKPPWFSGPVNAGSPQATGHTAEVTLTTRLQVPLLNSVTSILNGVLAILGTSINLGPINLGVDVQVAPATATLNRLQCPASNTPATAYLDAETAVATVSVGTFSGNPASNPPLSQTTAPIVSGVIKAVFGLASTNIYVDLNNPLSTTVGTGGGDLAPVNQFMLCGPSSTNPACGGTGGVPQPYFLALGAPNAPASDPPDNPQTVGSTDLLSSTTSTLFSSLQSAISTGDPNNPSKLCVLLVCVPLSNLLNPLASGVVASLTPVLVGTTGLVDTLLTPLLNALGVRVGAATVTMNTATFGQPVIVTNCLPGVAGANGCPAAASSS